MEKKSNGLGIASMIIGIFALLLSCCYGGFLGLIGLPLGIAGVTKPNKGTAIAGIVTSGLALLITLGVLIMGNGSLADYVERSKDSATENNISTENNRLTEDNVSANNDTSTTEPVSEENTPNTFVVGDTVEGNGFKMTFVSSGEYTSDNQFIQPGDGKKYMRFEFEFENTGDRDFLAYSWDFTCYADGYSVDQSYVADDVLSATISPGKKVIGAVYFEVPTDASEIELEYETNFWTEDKIVFTVQ